jgi:hypothetical protein
MALPRFQSISVLLLCAASVLASTVPRVDLPETAFNEADTPVNLAPPARPILQLVPTAVDPIAISPVLPLHNARLVAGSPFVESPVRPGHRHGHSLQDLLCTFLI